MDKFKEVYGEIISEGFWDKTKQILSGKSEEKEEENSDRDFCGRMTVEITCLKEGDKKTFFCKRINGIYPDEGKGDTISNAIIDWVKINNFGTDY